MQQEQVLTELFHYVNQSPQLDDATSIEATMKYLEVCNKLFEIGFLSAVFRQVTISSQSGWIPC